MKNLTKIVFSPHQCRNEWSDFQRLLATTPKLSERNDVLPFFKTHHNLSLLITRYFPTINTPDVYAHEYGIDGSFVADLVVGDSVRHHYVLVEFENGAPDSVFKTKGSKSTPDWSPRFEGAYSQLIDWLWKLEDKRSTSAFASTFGSREATFQGLIVIGKGMSLSAHEQSRLTWRMNRTVIDSNKVSVVSFEQLAVDTDHWLQTYYAV